MEAVEVLDITPEEARQRLGILSWGLVRTQYAAGWYVFHPIPERHLEIEIVQVMKGERIEFAGWTNPIEQALGWFWDRIIRPGLEWIWNDVIRPGVIAIVNAFRWIWDRLLLVANSIWNFLQGLVDKITSGLKKFFDLIWDGIRGIASAVVSGVKGLFDWIWSGIQRVGSAIWEGVKAIGGAIASGLSTIAGWITQALGKLGELIMAGLCWIWDNVIVPIGRTLYQLAKGIVDAFSMLIGYFVKTITGAILGLPSSPPQEVLPRVTDIFNILISTGGILAAQTIAGCLVHPFHEAGFGHISALCYDLSGYRPVISAIMAPITGTKIRIPLTYALNEMFRPIRPDMRTIDSAFGRGKIEDETAKQWYAWQGLHDDYFPVLKELAARPISAFILRYVAESDVATPQLMEYLTIDSGYGIEKGKLLAECMFAAVLKPYRLGAIASCARLYKEGFIIRPAFLSEVARIWTIRERDELIALRADYDYKFDMELDTLAAMRDAYRKLALTDEEWVALVRERRWDEAKYLLLLDREKFRLMPKPKR